MKTLVKIFRASFFIFFIFTSLSLQVHAAPAADEVGFSLRSEDITTQSGQVRRVYFNIQKGANAVPVSLTTTLGYAPELFTAVQSTDVVPSAGLNKVVSPNIDQNNPGIIRLSVGVEDYNGEALPAGELFYISFKVMPGVDLEANSVDFNYDINLGPNQAGTREATLLKVVNEWNIDFDNENTAAGGDKSSEVKAHSCFIGMFYWYVLLNLWPE